MAIGLLSDLNPDIDTTPTAIPKLWGITGEDLPTALIAEKVGPEIAKQVAPTCGLYQVVQETGAGPRFLTAWDTQEAAMRDCRALNVCTGSPFKTVVWGKGVPCLMCSTKSRQFKADNILPSLMFSPAAVKGYPDAYPVSAVYNHGTEVIFLPDGSPKNTQLADFSVGFELEPRDRNRPKMLYRAAVKSARELTRATGRRAYVTTRSRKSGRQLAVSSTSPSKLDLSRMGLGELSPWGSPPGKVRPDNPIVTPVTPSDFERLVEMSTRR